MTTDLHALIRTSPYGEDFVGVCTKCGREGLTSKNLREECENIRRVTPGQALAEIINPKKRN